VGEDILLLTLNGLENYNTAMLIMGNNHGGRAQDVFIFHKHPGGADVVIHDCYNPTSEYNTETTLAVNFSNRKIYGMFKANGWNFTQSMVAVYGKKI